ncbi:MAG: hypothetical protein K6F61_04010 [Clostridiales bacterium]|nr:hypothetical protein [Clostridiales bacterium]
MERIVTVADVKERYGCSRQTARKYLRECNPHMEKPLAAPEWAFQEWEDSRVVSKPKDLGREEFEKAVYKLRDARIPRRR